MHHRLLCLKETAVVVLEDAGKYFPSGRAKTRGVFLGRLGVNTSHDFKLIGILVDLP